MPGRAILLMGPTGAGKTDLAACLVERFPLEIVSVDAAMVYRGMDIGTAKPSPELLARAPHHLIDLIDPAESYSAARFLADADAAMQAIEARGRTPLLVGGTMLYFRAFQSGLARLPAADPAIRERLEARASAEGWPALHAELASPRPGIRRSHPPGRPPAHPARARGHRMHRPADVGTARREPARCDARRGSHRGARADGPQCTFRANWPQVRRHAGPGPRGRGRGAALARRPARGIAVDAADRLSPALGTPRGGGDAGRGDAKAVAATRQLARRQLTWLRAEPGAEWFDAFDASSPERIAARIAEWFRGRGIPVRRC